MAALAPAARRCLDRLELEHLDHAGKENGRLVVTYDDFARFGIRRASITSALEQLEAVGFLRVMERGRGGNSEYRKASKYRLTYLATNDAEPTDDWLKWSPPQSPPAQDIESRRENASKTVGAKMRPESPPP